MSAARKRKPDEATFDAVGASALNWKIVKVSDDLFSVVKPISDEDVARIEEAKGTWHVTFAKAPAFDWSCSTMRDGFDRCVGYVRGIERAIEVNARETGRAR